MSRHSCRTTVVIASDCVTFMSFIAMTGNYAPDLQLVAVSLVGDALHSDPNQWSADGDVLGFVRTASLSTPLSDFRQLMAEQVEALPPRFAFLSKQGWRVSARQESAISLYSVLGDDHCVRIRRVFDKQRFGVTAVHSGVALGFVCADLETTASEVRRLIARELAGVLAPQWLLVDRNDWPVATAQESLLKAWDLLRNGSFRVQTSNKRARVDYVDGPSMTVTDVDDSPEVDGGGAKRMAIEDVSHVAEQSAAYEPMATEIKPILISYVRAEAEQHARQLKAELSDLGCDVFLDVDEIDGGHDWQDALNNAVLNCDLFIPLITPQYGYTQWTNREVKLADIKKKTILPISFLHSWPPECLAIQFASTQYIPWKKVVDIERAVEKGEAERARDIRFWDQPYVRTAAKHIADLHHSTAAAAVYSTASVSTIQHTVTAEEVAPASRASTHRALRVNAITVSKTATATATAAEQSKRRVNVVISAHPKQRDLVSALREELTRYGFDVWSSTDMTIGSQCAAVLDCDRSDTSDQTLYLGGSSQYSMSESSQESVADLNARCSSLPAPSAVRQHRMTFALTSQTSVDYGSQTMTSFVTPEELDRANNFKARAESADFVVALLSEAYGESRTCKQQAFYCNLRKSVLAVRVEPSFKLPHWLSKLFADDDLLERGQHADGLELVEQIRQRLQSSAATATSRADDLITFRCAMSEARVHSLAAFLAKKLPLNDKKKVLVYVAGSTKFFCPLSEPICRAVGQALASIPFVVLVTGGSYGVGETIGRAFCEERELLLKEKPAALYHVLPRHVAKDSSLKARQNSDGTFQSLPFGHTLFVGHSFKERDSVVARLFHYCLLIEGGPRSARIAEEFVWNDNLVVPVICTGGASGGRFSLPAAIHEVPLGVHKDDWSTLGRRDVTAENIAEAVKNIICSLVKCRSRKQRKLQRKSGHKVRAKNV